MDGPQEGNASLREVMGSYPTGVTIVAARDDGGLPFGLTINSFTSVSLEPPLVLICIGHASRCHDRLVSGGHFSVNLLAQDQAATASRFASEPSDGRFEAVEWAEGPSGTPLLEHAVAALECSIQEVLRALERLGGREVAFGVSREGRVVLTPATMIPGSSEAGSRTARLRAYVDSLDANSELPDLWLDMDAELPRRPCSNCETGASSLDKLKGGQ